MIIGIDESGTFDLTTAGHSVIVGAHVFDEKDLKLLHGAFARWKDKYKSCKNAKGEIKSSSLNEEMFGSFVEDVLMVPGDFFFTTVATIGSGHKKVDIQLHRDYHVRCIDGGIAKCREVGNDRLAEQYVQLRNWYRGLSYQVLLKIWILGEAIGHSYRGHIFKAIADKRDQTLGASSIKIDEIFVPRKEHVIFWKDFLRSQIYNYTSRHPIPMVKEWPPSHPLLVAMGDDIIQTGSELQMVRSGSFFRDGCDFATSHATTEIQIADILAGILRSELNSDVPGMRLEKLLPFMMPHDRPIELLKMSSEINTEKSLDPYESFRKKDEQNAKTARV